MAAPEKIETVEMILKKFIREQNEHNRKVNFFMADQTATTSKLVDEVDKVKRGLYGDPENEVEGVITKQRATADKVKKIESQNTRRFAWATGAFAGVNGVIYLFKEFILPHK